MNELAEIIRDHPLLNRMVWVEHDKCAGRIDCVYVYKDGSYLVNVDYGNSYGTALLAPDRYDFIQEEGKQI